MVHERKRTNKRSPIRVNRKLDRSLKREKKKKHNGGRTLKKNRNKNKNKFKDYIQKGGADADVATEYKTYEDITRNYKIKDHWEPFTYQNPLNPEKKYLTFYHNNGPESLYEFTNFFYSPFTYDGVSWKTAEHYFQSCKSIVAFHLDDSNDYRGGWSETMIYYNSLNAAGEVFNAGSQIDFNTHLKPKFWGGFRPGRNIGLTEHEYFKQPAALKYQIMLNALYQKFLQNKRFRNKLKQLTETYILVEDSRSNDDSWGNGFKRKRGKVWSSDPYYYKGLWTGGEITEGYPNYSPKPYNSDNHRNNILGITLTCLGKLFIEYDNPLGEGEGVDIKKCCDKWIEILRTHLGYDVSDLFNIFPWEHWTTSLKRNNTSIVKVNKMIQKLESPGLNKYKTDVLTYQYGYASGIGKIDYDIKINYGEVNGCEIFDYLISENISPLYTYYFTDTGYTKTMLEEMEKKHFGIPLRTLLKNDGYDFMEHYGYNQQVDDTTEFVALSENDHKFYDSDKNAGIIEKLNAYIGGDKDSVYEFEIQKEGGGGDEFKVFFGQNAHSSRIPCEKSMSGIIQVNTETGDTRIVITKEMYHDIIMSDPFSLLLLTNLEAPSGNIGGIIPDPGKTISSDVTFVTQGNKTVIKLDGKDITTIEPESKPDGVYVDGYLTFVKDENDSLSPNLIPVPSQERYMGAEPLDFVGIKSDEPQLDKSVKTSVDFKKVPVIGYKYDTVSNKYLAQKYTDVLFLFNDHLTDYNGMAGAAGIRNLPNAFGIPLGCYDKSITESYPGKTQRDIEQSIKDDNENLSINVNYTVNSGNKFNRKNYDGRSFIDLLNKLIDNIKELIWENNYKAVVFNCVDGDGDDSQPEFGIQLFSKEKGYNQYANKKMIELLKDNISDVQNIDCINDSEIEEKLNKLGKINPIIQAKEKHEEYEKEKATKPKTSPVTPTDPKTPTPMETLPDPTPLTEIKYRKVSLTNYEDKYNFIKKPSDLVFEEELTERINDHECLAKLLLLDRFIDYTKIQKLPKPTFYGYGKENITKFDGNDGKLHNENVSKNILVCQIKFLGNMNMYIIYNTVDKFVLCSPCFDPPVYNIYKENSKNFSIPFRNGCKYLPIHIVDFKRHDNYMELTFYMNGKKYKYESDDNLEENFKSYVELLDEAKEINNKEQIIEKRLIKSKSLVDRIKPNRYDSKFFKSGHGGLLLREYNNRIHQDATKKGILSYKPDGSDSKQEYYFDVKINEGGSYETIAKGTCFYNSEFKEEDSEVILEKLEEYQGNMDEKTKIIMEDYSRDSAKLRSEYKEITVPTVEGDPGPTVVKESTSFFKKVKIKLPVKKTYSTPKGISEQEQHKFLEFAKNFKWNEMFQMLETNPLLVNSEPGSPKRWTALHQAAFARDLGVYQRLINEFGANPNIINRDGHIASYYLTNKDVDEQSDTFYKIKVLPEMNEIRTISYTGEMLTIPVDSFYYYKKISEGKKIIIGYNNTYNPPLDKDGTVYQIPEELLNITEDYKEFKLSSGSEVTRSVISDSQSTPRIDSPKKYPDWEKLDDYHKNKLCHTFLDLIKRWKDEYKNLFDNYASNEDAKLGLVKFTGDVEGGSRVGGRWTAYVQLYYWISSLDSADSADSHQNYLDNFKYDIESEGLTIPGKGIFKDITDYNNIEKIDYFEPSEPSEPSEKFIDITKINNSFTKNVFSIYKYDFLTIDISDAIKNISKKLYDNIKKETLLILPRQIESEHIDNIKNHLRHRHPLHIGGPIWNRTNNDKFRELLGYDEKTANQNDYNVRGIQGVRDTTGGKIVDKMWYGILGYTEWIDPVPEDPKLLEYRPTEKSAYFLHTWGVNLESNRTPHYYYCFVESIGFNIERYKTLLDNMFSVVENAGRHLLDIYPNNLIIIRISQLGLGAWANYIPDDKKHEIIEYYRMKLNEITTRNENIMIQFVMFPKNETYWIRNGDHIYTENNHDPFGKKVDIGTEDYKLIIVNAWDEGSFIGNGGSQDNTLDGWTVAGGSDLYGGFYYGIGDKRLGYYAKNYSYLHNFFFQPQLLNEKEWYPLPVVAEVVKGTPVQVVEEEYIQIISSSDLSKLVNERKMEKKSLEADPDTSTDKIFELNNSIVTVIINEYKNKEKTYKLNELYSIIIQDLYGNDREILNKILKEKKIEESDDIKDVFEIIENNIEFLSKPAKYISRDIPSNPRINPSADSVEGYVELNVTNSKGDGNCGFHSVIYAIVMQTQNGLEGLVPNNNNTTGIFNDDVDVLSFNDFCKSPNKNIILQNDNGLDINIDILKTLDIAETDIFHETHNPENYISIKRNIINLFRAYMLYLSFKLNIEETIFKSGNEGKQQELENFRVLLSFGIVNDGEQIIDIAELDAMNGVSIISFLLGIPIVNSVRQYDGTGWQIHLPNTFIDDEGQPTFKTDCNPISLRPHQLDGGDDLFPRLFYYRMMDDEFKSSETESDYILTNEILISLLNAPGCKYYEKFKDGLELNSDGKVFKLTSEGRLMTHKNNKNKIIDLSENFLKKLNPKPLFFNNIPGHYQYSRIISEKPDERNIQLTTHNQLIESARLNQADQLEQQEQDNIAKAIAASLEGKTSAQSITMGKDLLNTDLSKGGNAIPESKKLYQDFRARGGIIVDAPKQDYLENLASKGLATDYFGIKKTDFLIPVCHQGFNRSQVLRKVLIDVLDDNEINKNSPDNIYVSRAHGAVSGCDAHDNGKPPPDPLNEMNFFTFLHDEGTAFKSEYTIETDTDPQSQPLQMGFRDAFRGFKKMSRIGEHLVNEQGDLNPTSEYTRPAEFETIRQNRQVTYNWFNEHFYDSLENLKKKYDGLNSDVDFKNTLPPKDVKRRIFFCFARAGDITINRLLNQEKNVQDFKDTIVVKLNYDDKMNHTLRHCGGDDDATRKKKMKEVHEDTYNMYKLLIRKIDQ